MKCEQVKEWLVEYVLKEFKNPWISMVRDHISECKACANEVKEIRYTFEIMSKADEIEVPKDLALKLMQKVDSIKVFRKAIRFLKAPIPLYSVIGILIMFCIIAIVPKAVKPPESPYRVKGHFSYLITDTSFLFTPSDAVKTSLSTP